MVLGQRWTSHRGDGGADGGYVGDGDGGYGCGDLICLMVLAAASRSNLDF